MFSTFVQDDWQIAPTVKILYGVRYDLYKYPAGHRRRAADADARASTSTGTTSVRASAWPGRSIRRHGAARAAPGSCTTSRSSAATSRRCSCPDRRARRSTRSTARRRARRRSRRRRGTGTVWRMQSPWAVDPDFVVAHTWQTNAQLERAFGQRPHGVGQRHVREGIRSAGRDQHQPDQPDRDARPTAGRSTTRRASAATRLDPRFNLIQEVQSIGDSTFKSMTLQVDEAASRRGCRSTCSTRSARASTTRRC